MSKHGLFMATLLCLIGSTSYAHQFCDQESIWSAVALPPLFYVVVKPTTFLGIESA